MLLEKTFYKFKAMVLFLKGIKGSLVNVESYFSYFIVIRFIFQNIDLDNQR